MAPLNAMVSQAEWWCWKEKSFRLKQEFSKRATRQCQACVCFATLCFDIINITITITIQVIVIIAIGIRVIIRI